MGQIRPLKHLSSDNGILINRKTLEAYYWQGNRVCDEKDIIATGKTLDELIDNTRKWILEGEEEAKKSGYYFDLEYGIDFIN